MPIQWFTKWIVAKPEFSDTKSLIYYCTWLLTLADLGGMAAAFSWVGFSADDLSWTVTGESAAGASDAAAASEAAFGVGAEGLSSTGSTTAWVTSVCLPSVSAEGSVTSSPADTVRSCATACSCGCSTVFCSASAFAWLSTSAVGAVKWYDCKHTKLQSSALCYDYSERFQLVTACTALIGCESNVCFYFLVISWGNAVINGYWINTIHNSRACLNLLATWLN